jgi:hypothetical protein
MMMNSPLLWFYRDLYAFVCLIYYTSGRVCCFSVMTNEEILDQISARSLN